MRLTGWGGIVKVRCRIGRVMTSGDVGGVWMKANGENM